MPLPELDRLTLVSVRLLATASDTHGDYFPGHSHGVAYIIRLMGLEAAMDPDHLALLELAAMLHDAGKLLVPSGALAETGTLSTEQWARIKEHPVHSARLAECIGGRAATVAPWVRHHHERVDGAGYPDGLAGDAIPHESRLLLVADAFHVMTTGRPYSATRSRSTAIRELNAHAGEQFCPSAIALLNEARPADP